MSDGICSVEGCARRAKSRGWCQTHYNRWWKYGDTSVVKSTANPTRSISQRFWEKVAPADADDCWLWTAATDDGGYGCIGSGGHRGRRLRAHRWAYEQLRAEIPDGLVLDHLCRTPACVNPWHLEPVTHRVNVVLRGTGPAARAAVATACKHGHPFTPENTVRYGRARRCRTCQREAAKARYHRNHPGAPYKAQR